MAELMSDNFAGSPGSAFAGDSFFTATGPCVLVASHYGVAVRFAGGGVVSYLSQTAFTGTTGPRYFSRLYKISGNPSVNTQLFQARSSSAAIATALLRTDGRLALTNGGLSTTYIANTSAAVPMGTEFRVVYGINGTSFTADVYADISSTTPLYSISGTITGGTITNTREGFPSSTAAATTVDLAWPVDGTTDPGLRKFVFLTLDSVSGIVPKTINATIGTENLPAGTRAYSITWGDGATSGPQAGSTFTHTYTEPGTFDAIPSVEVT